MGWVGTGPGTKGGGGDTAAEENCGQNGWEFFRFNMLSVNGVNGSRSQTCVVGGICRRNTTSASLDSGIDEAHQLGFLVLDIIMKIDKM